MTGKDFSILLVEDNPADVRVAKDAFKYCKSQSTLNVVKDGVEAMAYLHHTSPFENTKKPDLIMLDLNLPRKDGREVLAEIKSDANLKRIPVVVLTTSRAEKDIIASYNLNANCYITKPADVDEYFEMICNTENFWLKTAVLASR